MNQYAHDVFLSEEIGNQVSSKLKASLTNLKVEQVVKTEEKRPTHPHIINHKINEADRWYEIKLPVTGLKTWSLSLRESQDLLYSFEPSGSTYITLKKGATLSEDTTPEDLDIHAIYVRCATADVTVELELWLYEPEPTIPEHEL